MLETNLIERIKANDPSLIQLELAAKNLSDQDIKTLAELLPSNTTITAIDLSQNPISSAGVYHIFNALRKNTRITNLNLSSIRSHKGRRPVIFPCYFPWLYTKDSWG